MPDDQYHLEGVLQEGANLIRLIREARSSLEHTSHRLEAISEQHNILNEAKRNVSRLYDQTKSLHKRNKQLDSEKRSAEDFVSILHSKLQTLKEQTRMTETYLQHLDHLIEASLAEEDEAKGELERQQQAEASGEGGRSGGEEEDVAWTREEEVMYLQLLDRKAVLESMVEAKRIEHAARKESLSAMLETLLEGEGNVASKAAHCSSLEETAKAMRERVAAFFSSTRTSMDRGDEGALEILNTESDDAEAQERDHRLHDSTSREVSPQLSCGTATNNSSHNDTMLNDTMLRGSPSR